MKIQLVSVPNLMLIAALFAASGSVNSGDVVHAAAVSWKATIVDTTNDANGSPFSPGAGLGDAAVSMNGTLVEAANFGSLSDVTVNGVLFKGVDFMTIPSTHLSIGYDATDNIGDFGITGTTTGGQIDFMTSSFGRDANVSAHSAMLTGLTIGQHYEVQFLASFRNRLIDTTFDDGAGRSITLSQASPHQFATGVFTADATTQAVNFTAGSGSQFLNGYQLRAVTTPPVFGPTLTINRETGGMTLSSDVATTILGYAMTSGIGTLDQSGWTPITGHYDVSGNKSVDIDDNWTVLSSAASTTDLSEAQLGGLGPENGGVIPAAGSGIGLSSGGAWTQWYEEDVEMKLLYPDGTVAMIPVFFVGNGGEPFAKGDLDFDGNINASDHAMFAAGLHTDVSSLSIFEAYARGDMNEDRFVNFDDFVEFQAIYDGVNGAGAFAALQAAIPEPTTLLLLLCAAPIPCFRSQKRFTNMRTNHVLQRTLIAGLIVAAAWFSAEKSAFAANISWMETIVDTTDDPAGGPFLPGTGLGDAAVSTRGTLVEAANFGVLDDFTVNGVLFNGIDFSVPPTNLSIGYDSADNTPTFANGGTTTGGVIDNLTASFGRDANVSMHNAMLTGLTIGHNYEVQFLSSFARLNRTTTYDDGNGNAIVLSTNNPHAFATGTFTADATTQAIRFTASTGSQFLSAYQLREISEPVFLNLLVDPATGQVRITNETPDAIDINYYEITSAMGALDPSEGTGWRSLDDQNLDAIGPAAGESWTQAGGSSAKILSEFFTLGSTSVAPSERLNLGKAFKAAGAQDLEFRYAAPGAISLTTGTVTYGTIDTGGVAGDYNGNGIVDAADYAAWRNNVGAPAGTLPNDVDGGAIGQAQYVTWRSNFGAVAGSGALAGRAIAEPLSGGNAAAVPEPSSLVLVLAMFGALTLCKRSFRKGASVMIARQGGSKKNWDSSPSLAALNAVAILITVSAGMQSSVLATVTNDREYWFGEDSLEGATQGAVIGSSNSPPLVANDSADSKGPTGAFLDLTRSGNPTYQDVDATGGLNRPGASNGDFGVRFDGQDDLLTATPLNRPDQLDTLVGGGYPLNYTGITARGLQLWVYPNAAALGTQATPTKFQSIVADSNRAGGPAINEFGKWTQINGNRFDGSNGAAAIPATVDVAAGNTWYHVMQHNYPIAGNSFLGVLYVDGIAVSANIANIPTTPDTNFVHQLVVGAAEVANNGLSPDYDFHFVGVVDDLEMYVVGNNSSEPGGQDYGTFDLFADNKWIADEIAKTVPGGALLPGDVDKDGDVDDGDITAFVAGWLKENRLPTVQGTSLVGDWSTWDDGDLNHDGVTNLDDAFVLHEALKSAGAAGLDFGLLRGALPEPSSITLIAMAIAAVANCRSRNRRRTACR